MGNSLEHLLAEGVISEIITRLKSGKEADVYAVRQGGKVIAAKVYKDRAHRSFKNNAAYKEGRSVRNSRSQRAIDRGSKFGKDAAEDAWKATEANTLYKLHAAGVRVPTPVMYLEGVLFMELVLDANGQAAPRLIDSDLSVDEAHGAYLDMLTQLVRILSCDLIHGDLSPYNVLWAVTGPTIIDFPQCVSASHSSNSENFFLRDARNILGHFAGIDPRLTSRSGDAPEIWRAYVRRELSADFVPSGRPARTELRPRLAEPSSPRPANHRGPPQQPAANPQHRNSPGPRQAFVPPAQGSGNSQRNPPPARSSFASAPKSHPAPGHSRGGPRRPDVIVLTRRSPKPSGAPEHRSSEPSPAATSRFNPNPKSHTPRPNANPRSDSNPNPSPRFSPNPRSDSNPRSNPNPRSDSNPNPNPHANPNPRVNASASANPNRSSSANRSPNASAQRTPAQNLPPGAAGDVDANSPTQRKRRRRRRARTPEH